MKTFQEAQAEVRELCRTNPPRYARLRRQAADDLEREMVEWLGEDHGEGIGTSDVSCHMIEMVRTGELVL